MIGKKRALKSCLSLLFLNWQTPKCVLLLQFLFEGNKTKSLHYSLDLNPSFLVSEATAVSTLLQPLPWLPCWLFYKWAVHGLFFLIFVCVTVDIKPNDLYKKRLWLVSNPCPLVSEATALRHNQGTSYLVELFLSLSKQIFAKNNQRSILANIYFSTFDWPKINLKASATTECEINIRHQRPDIFSWKVQIWENQPVLQTWSSNCSPILCWKSPNFLKITNFKIFGYLLNIKVVGILLQSTSTLKPVLKVDKKLFQFFKILSIS